MKIYPNKIFIHKYLGYNPIILKHTKNTKIKTKGKKTNTYRIPIHIEETYFAVTKSTI